MGKAWEWERESAVVGHVDSEVRDDLNPPFYWVKERRRKFDRVFGRCREIWGIVDSFTQGPSLHPLAQCPCPRGIYVLLSSRPWPRESSLSFPLNWAIARHFTPVTRGVPSLLPLTCIGQSGGFYLQSMFRLICSYGQRDHHIPAQWLLKHPSWCPGFILPSMSLSSAQQPVWACLFFNLEHYWCVFVYRHVSGEQKTMDRSWFFPSTVWGMEPRLPASVAIAFTS